MNNNLDINTLEQFQHLITIFNELPSENRLEPQLDRVARMGSNPDSIEMQEFYQRSIAFFESLNERLIGFLGEHAVDQTVLGWWETLRSLSTQKLAVVNLIALLERIRENDRRAGTLVKTHEPKEATSHADSRPVKGSLEHWFQRWTQARTSSDRLIPPGEMHMIMSIRAKRNRRFTTVSMKLAPVVESDGSIRLKDNPLALLLSRSSDIDLERLKICPVCFAIFYAKRIGPNRFSLTCGIKRCVDTLGNRRRKKANKSSRPRSIIKIRPEADKVMKAMEREGNKDGSA